MSIRSELTQRTRILAKTDVGNESWSANLQMRVNRAADSDIGFFVVAYAALQHARDERLTVLSHLYDEASATLSRGDFVQAESQFISLGDYSDAKQQARLAKEKDRQRVQREAELRKKNEAEYERALGFVQRRKYSAALEIFTSLGSFRDSFRKAQELRNNESRYQSACSMMSGRNFRGAIQSFTGLGDYKDSAQKKKEAEKLLKKDEYSKQVKDIDNRISRANKKREELLEQKKQFDKAQRDLESGSGTPDSSGCLGGILIGVGIWQMFVWVPSLLGVILGGMSNSADGASMSVNTTMLLFSTIFGPGFLGIYFYLRSKEKQRDVIWEAARKTLDELPENLIPEYESIEKELETLRTKKANLKKP